MENKGNSVFEKLDDQGQKIDDISDKLKDVNENDLFALAKRCWNYKDFKSAQKYFTQVSLINPLNWEASLYASLCNFRGGFTINYIVTFPDQVENIVIATIDYINDLSLSKEEKEIEISKLFNIIKEYIEANVRNYENNKRNFENYDITYPLNLELYIYNIYNKIISLGYVKDKEIYYFLLEQISKIIIISDVVCDYIDKTTLKEIQSIKDKKTNLDSFDKGSNLKNSRIFKNEDKKVLCLEYKDKKKGRINNIVDILCGALLSIISILGLIFVYPKEYNNIYLSFFILSLISGLFLLLKGITQIKIIKIKSIFYVHNVFNLYDERVLQVIKQRKIYFSTFCFFYQTGLSVWAIMYLLLETLNKSKDIYFIVLLVFYLLACITLLVIYLKKGESRIYYLQNGKKYYLD